MNDQDQIAAFFKASTAISSMIWSEGDKLEIEQFLNSCSQSDNLAADFYSYCEKWKLAPWTYSQLQKNDLLHYIPNQVRELFQAAHEKVKQQNEARNEQAKSFLSEFKKRGIEVIILKGNLFVHTVYEDVGYKRMNDFDILVKKEDWDRIQDVYLELGYIPLGFGWSGEKEKPAKFSHVGMSFISPDYSCIIGTQWGLKSPTTNFNVNIKEAWQTAQPFNFMGIEVKALSTEYNLLHLILHLGIFKCGIRDCMDIYNLIQKETIDEDHLLRIIRASNADDKAYFAFKISRLCRPVLDEVFIEKLNTGKSSFIKRRLKKRLRVAEENVDFQISYNDYFQDVEKVVIYFNVYPKFHKKFVLYLRILRMVYFPSRNICLKLNDRLHHHNRWIRFTSRLKAPYMVFALIAQEIGWKFTILLFIKLFLDLILSLKNYIVPKPSYFDYLKKRGIDPKDIQKAVKNIQ